MAHALYKTVLSFVSLWLLTRFLLGKKQIGHLTLFDYITGITLGSLAATMIAEEDYIPHLGSLILWAALTALLHTLDLKGRATHRLLDDSPTMVIRNGQIQEGALRRERVNIEELMSLLRQAGYFHLEEVEYALLEPNGTLSVLPRSQYRPLQPHDLSLPTEYEGLQIQVMQEGRPLAHGLQTANLSDDWLRAELARQQVLPEEVYAAWLNPQGKLVVDRYDHRQPH